MRVKKAIFLIIIVFLAVSLFATSVEDAEYIFIEKHYKINSDNSWTLNYSSKVKLNTYLATRRFFGESFLTYNPRYQTLKILKSMTIMKNGKIVPTPENGYNEVLPRAAHTFPVFSFLREMVVSHTGLERGAFEEFSYEIKTKKGFYPYFFALEPLKERFPIKKLIIVFEVPENLNLFFYTKVANLKPITKNEKGRKVYRFELNNLKKFISYDKSNYPMLYITSDKVSSLNKFFKQETLSNELLNKVKNIREKSEDVYNFLLNLQSFVAEDIQNVNLGIDETGFYFRNINKVYKSRYGTEAEKVKLLYSILSSLNMKPQIVIFSPFKNRKGISPYDKFFVKVEIKGKDYFIDPTKLQSEFYPYGYDNFFAYDLNGNSINYKLKTAEDNLLSISGTIYFNKDKKNELILKTTGIFNDYRKALRNTQNFASSIVKRTLNLEKIKVEKVLVKSPFKTLVKIKTCKLPFKNNYKKIFFLKAFNIPFLNIINFNNLNSNTPITFKSPFKISYNLNIYLPKNIKVEYLADPIFVKNKAGVYKRIVKIKEGRLNLKLDLEINKGEFTNKEALKKIYEEWKKDRFYIILLKK